MKDCMSSTNCLEQSGQELTILDLPAEIIEEIACHLDVQTLCSFAQVCSVFYSIQQESNMVWKKAFSRRYSTRLLGSDSACCGRHHLETLLQEQADGSWRKMTELRYRFGTELRAALDNMAELYYSIGDLPDPALEEVNQLIDQRGMTYVREELYMIMTEESGKGEECRLARRHYATMLFRQLQRRNVILPRIQDFMQRPVHHINGSEAAYLFNMWLVPEKEPGSEAEIRLQYVRLAEMVLDRLRSLYPNHPAASWATCHPYPFGCNMFTDSESCQMLDTINTVLFEELALLEPPQFPRNEIQQHFYQLFVFCGHARTTPPAGVSFVYSTVAGTLGVNLNPVQMCGFLFLRWHRADDQPCLFVDLTRAGRLCTGEEVKNLPMVRLRGASDRWFRPIDRRQLLTRMILGTVRNPEPTVLDSDRLALDELAILVENDCITDLHVLSNLVQVYGDIRPLYTAGLILNYLENMVVDVQLGSDARLRAVRDTAALLKQRYEDVKKQCKQARELSVAHRDCRQPDQQTRFRVGDVVRHRRYHYRAVVSGWTPVCAASRSWQQQMNVAALSAGCDQPFYHLLADNGANYYAASENLELCLEVSPIAHREIGRYFVRRDAATGRYIPLDSLLTVYPDPEQAEARGIASKLRSAAERSRRQQQAAAERSSQQPACSHTAHLLHRTERLGPWPADHILARHELWPAPVYLMAAEDHQHAHLEEPDQDPALYDDEDDMDQLEGAAEAPVYPPAGDSGSDDEDEGVEEQDAGQESESEGEERDRGSGGKEGDGSAGGDAVLGAEGGEESREVEGEGPAETGH